LIGVVVYRTYVRVPLLASLPGSVCTRAYRRVMSESLMASRPPPWRIQGHTTICLGSAVVAAAAPAVCGCHAAYKPRSSRCAQLVPDLTNHCTCQTLTEAVTCAPRVGDFDWAGARKMGRGLGGAERRDVLLARWAQPFVAEGGARSQRIEASQMNGRGETHDRGV